METNSKKITRIKLKNNQKGRLTLENEDSREKISLHDLTRFLIQDTRGNLHGKYCTINIDIINVSQHEIAVSPVARHVVYYYICKTPSLSSEICNFRNTVAKERKKKMFVSTNYRCVYPRKSGDISNKNFSGWKGRKNIRIIRVECSE